MLYDFCQDMMDYSYLVEDITVQRTRKRRKGTKSCSKVTTVAINGKELYEESMEALCKILKG